MDMALGRLSILAVPDKALRHLVAEERPKKR
jgi:hypothetical protein